MIRLLPVLVFLLFGQNMVVAQTTSVDSIKTTINTFFEGMKKHDTTMMRSTLAPTCIFQTIKKSKEGIAYASTENINDFLIVIGKPSNDIFDERITFDRITFDDFLASVWTPYRFYVNEKFSHYGNNSFQLIKINHVWKIQYVIDTRKRGKE
jgi:hypothetical protein